jgi:hypothetical protein
LQRKIEKQAREETRGEEKKQRVYYYILIYISLPVNYCGDVSYLNILEWRKQSHLLQCLLYSLPLADLFSFDNLQLSHMYNLPLVLNYVIKKNLLL